jgi:hypothetical protein
MVIHGGEARTRERCPPAAMEESKMQRLNTRLVAVAAAFGLAAGLSGLALAQEGGRPINVTMTGAAETPPGDPDGTGTASFRINPGQMQVCYTLKVSGIAAASAAHIHKGAAGASGAPVVPLMAPTSGTSEGCATTTREIAQDLIQNPSAYYVNVHNAEFPGGALRAQLAK